MSNVHHPAHYGGDDTYEVIKVIEAWGLDKDAYLFNTIKYIARAGKKPDQPLVQDLKKALWYLERRVNSLKSSETKNKVTYYHAEEYTKYNSKEFLMNNVIPKYTVFRARKRSEEKLIWAKEGMELTLTRQVEYQTVQHINDYCYHNLSDTGTDKITPFFIKHEWISDELFNVVGYDYTLFNRSPKELS